MAGSGLNNAGSVRARGFTLRAQDFAGLGANLEKYGLGFLIHYYCISK
jgi:hypothetical protein